MNRLLRFVGLAGICAAHIPGLAPPAMAQSTDAYIGEIVFNASKFCPRGWLPADGSMIATAQYPALFSLMGTTYGGDGKTSFALPNLNGRSVNGTSHKMASLPNHNHFAFHTDKRTLSEAEMPAHDHGFDIPIDAEPYATGQLAGEASPKQAYLASQDNVAMYTHNSNSLKDMGTNPARLTIDYPTQNTGQGDSFSVRDPYITLTACICVAGLFPHMPK